MAELVLKGVRLLISGFDMSGKHNSLTINHTADILDRTCFNSSARKRLAGLTDMDMSLEGYWGSTNVDKQSFDNIGSSGRVVTVVPTTTDGQTAFMGRGCYSGYIPGGTVGELLGFSVSIVGSETPSLVRGKLLCGRQTTGVGSSSGASISFGVPTSTQKLYATFHLCQPPTTDLSGGKVGGEIVGSCSSGFTVGATTMISIALTSATTGQWATTTSTGTSTSKSFYRFAYRTTGTPNLQWFVCAGYR